MVQVIALMLGGLLKILSTHEFLGSCLHMSTNLLRVYYVRKQTETTHVESKIIPLGVS